jgi:DNA-binding transcriptional LysR family regulator
MIQISDPIETAELAAFVRASEVRSLTRAEAELGIPRATLGRRLARLEERLGTRLLRRTTRSLVLTDAGDVFYQRARDVLGALADAESAVRRRDNVMRGDVRVSLPPIMHDSFPAMISAFVKEHPRVRVHVDFTGRVIDLHSERYDVALRASMNLEPGLIARVIGKHKVIAVASPAYLAEMGTPKTVKDLRDHRCVTGDSVSSTWPTINGIVRVEGIFSSNDNLLRREAAVRAMGIALIPDVLIGEHLASGALVQVLAGIIEAPRTLAVVYLERAFLAPQVRAFIDALIEWAPIVLPQVAKPVRKPRSPARHPRVKTDLRR